MMAFDHLYHNHKSNNILPHNNYVFFTVNALSLRNTFSFYILLVGELHRVAFIAFNQMKYAYKKPPE